ncbi:hypothetical protein EYZ11_001745 [Aspergillus tanneri]|uniref:FAD-binding domain-containing protein n=1 Tax=Aspergillus tanneri TaxID=1220188 RepID=A0A4S3JSP0_9EURO|nr:hypothetical protein EYZ11_001745 [Aspergillus tanneri]
MGYKCGLDRCIHPEKKPANSSCLHASVDTAAAVNLGLMDYSKNSALEYWGGHNNVHKIVLSPYHGGSLLSYCCFFPREKQTTVRSTGQQKEVVCIMGDAAHPRHPLGRGRIPTKCIGFSGNTDDPLYTVKDEANKLTIREMNAYNMHEDLLPNSVSNQLPGCDPETPYLIPSEEPTKRWMGLAL